MLNLGKDIAVLKRMTVTELRARYAEVFGGATRSGNKDWLRKRIAWRIQANASGDLSARARRRADELANDADLRTTAPKDNQVAFDHDARLPMPGATLRRPYTGREVVGRVLPRGVEYEGEVYRTLSAVARAVTGTHWNGYPFLNLPKVGQA